jgi:hypothetical protein
MTGQDELKSLLGLGDDDQLELVHTLPLESIEVGLGFAPAELDWNELESSPHWQELSLGAPIELFAWQEQAGIFRVSLSAEGDFEVLRGAAQRLDARTFHLDARRGEVVGRARLESGDDIALCVERSDCRFFRVVSPLSLPDLTTFTGGIDAQPWLDREYDDLASSPGVADRVAAVGLVLRLWQPETPEARTRVLEQTLRSGSELLEHVKRWAAQLSPVVCGQCADIVQATAEALEDALIDVDATLELGGAAARSLATHIALERDRLESIFAVLALRGDVAKHRAALDRLDEQASLLLGQLCSAGVNHPRLERAAEAEPFAWWGALASP